MTATRAALIRTMMQAGFGSSGLHTPHFTRHTSRRIRLHRFVSSLIELMRVEKNKVSARERRRTRGEETIEREINEMQHRREVRKISKRG